MLKRHRTTAKKISVGIFGRTSKKQRAAILKFIVGGANLSKFVNAIDYNFASAKLKYGMVGIKIWMEIYRATKSHIFKSYRDQQFYASLKHRKYFQFINRTLCLRNLRKIVYRRKKMVKIRGIISILNSKITADTIKYKRVSEAFNEVFKTLPKHSSRVFHLFKKPRRNVTVRSFHRAKLIKKKEPLYYDFIKMAKLLKSSKAKKISTIENQLQKIRLENITKKRNALVKRIESLTSTRSKRRVRKLVTQLTEKINKTEVIKPVKKIKRVKQVLNKGISKTRNRKQVKGKFNPISLLKIVYREKRIAIFRIKIKRNNALKILVSKRNLLKRIKRKNLLIRNIQFHFNLSFFKKRRSRMFFKKTFLYRNRRWKLLNRIYKYYRKPKKIFTKHINQIFKKEVINRKWNYSTSKRLYYQALLQRKYFKYLSKRKKLLKRLKKKLRRISYLERYIDGYYRFKRIKRYPRMYKFQPSLFNSYSKFISRRRRSFKCFPEERIIRRKKLRRRRRYRRKQTLNLKGLLFSICPEARFVPRPRYRKYNTPLRKKVARKRIRLFQPYKFKALKLLSLMYKRSKNKKRKNYIYRRSYNRLYSFKFLNRVFRIKRLNKYKKKVESPFDLFDKFKRKQDNKNKIRRVGINSFRAGISLFPTFNSSSKRSFSSFNYLPSLI